jgi:hypothetical protein
MPVFTSTFVSGSHNGLIAFRHESFVVGHRRDRGRDSVDEVDSVLLGSPLKDLAVGGPGEILHGEVTRAVVADRIDSDPVTLVEFGVVVL